MVSGEPQNEQKKNGEGSHHLHLFHARDDRPKGGSKGCRREPPAE